MLAAGRAIRIAGIVLLVATSSLATTIPECVLDAQKREPELWGIYIEAGADAPRPKDYIGRTWKEYREESREHRRAYKASLLPGTADFVLGKLNTALSAEPPDLPVVWLALCAAEFAPDPRIADVAAQFLDDLSLLREQEGTIYAAMAQMVISGNPGKESTGIPTGSLNLRWLIWKYRAGYSRWSPGNPRHKRAANRRMVAVLYHSCENPSAGSGCHVLCRDISNTVAG